MYKQKLTKLSLLINCSLASAALLAQDVQRTSLEEVVVTARKREEAVQSVPLAISAMTGEMLLKDNVTDVSSLSNKVPGLQIVPGTGANKSIPVFAIRGQSQQELTILADSSVAVYFGDIVNARSYGMNQAMYDIQSVEVLKGPQGTLFGRNSTGGAISIHPNVPNEVFEGYVEGAVGSFDRIDTGLMLNIPVSDIVQFRVAGKTTSSDGYFKDVILDKEINDEETYSGRVQMRIAPTDGLESIFSYSRFLEDSGGSGGKIYAYNTSPTVVTNANAAALGYTGANSPVALLAQQNARGFYKTASGLDQYIRVATWDASNTTTWDINDNLSVKNITGYRSIYSHSSDDSDGLPLPILQIERRAEFGQFTEELQVYGSTANFEWIVGGYYFHEQGSNWDPSINIAPLSAAASQARPQPVASEFPNYSLTNVSGDNKSKSVFGQTTYNFADWNVEDLSLTVGARYTWDTRAMSVYNRGRAGTLCSFSLDTDGNPATPEQVPSIANCRLDAEEDFGQSTYNISLDYQLTPDALLYIAHRKGYRSGGFGARATTQAGLERTFKPEVVKDIEVGAKVDWRFDNGMSARTNLAIYQSDYTDIQRLLQDPNRLPTTTVTTNAGEAEINGAELELTFLPLDGLELSAFYSYTNAKFVKFIAPNGADLSHNEMARAPENTYSARIRYTLPLPTEMGDVSLQANYWHSDNYTSSDSVDPTTSMPAYSLVNVRADWASVLGSPFDVGVFCNNLTEEEYEYAYLSVYSNLGTSSRTPGEPRTIGLEVKYRFGGLAD